VAGIRKKEDSGQGRMRLLRLTWSHVQAISLSIKACNSSISESIMYKPHVLSTTTYKIFVIYTSLSTISSLLGNIIFIPLP
jgi:hypothetical protein